MQTSIYPPTIRPASTQDDIVQLHSYAGCGKKSLFFLLFIVLPLLSLAQENIEDFTKQRQQDEPKKNQTQTAQNADQNSVKKRTMTINNILFDVNSASLADKDKRAVDTDIIPYILGFPPSTIITVEGHTDNTGKAKENITLSQKRADSVQAYLVTQGIDESRLMAVGYGASRPIATNKTEQGRKMNRRVTVTIENTGSKAVVGTIVMNSGERIDAKYLYIEPDGTVSYIKSDTDPTLRKKQSSEVKYVEFIDGTSRDPKNGSVGTIVMKNGQQIPARMIAREPGYVSYKKSDTAPIVKLKESEVRSIKYPNGKEVPIDNTRPVVVSKKEGVVKFRDGKNLKVADAKTYAQYATYKVSANDSVVTVQKPDLMSVKQPDGRLRIYNLFPRGWRFFDKFPTLTRLSAFANLGVVPLNVKQASINFAYVDESPSKDNMQSVVQLNSRFIGYGGQIGGEFELDSTTVWRGYYQFAANSEGATNAVGFGIGKILGHKKNKRIGVDLQFGSAYVKLGDIFQNDLFIQVNQSRFYSNSVAIRYRNYFAAIHPYFSIEKPLKNNFSLRLTLGLAAGLHTKSLITFKGYDNSNKSVTATEKLTEPNVSFSVNGEKSTNTQLFSILGPQVSAAVYYTIYRK